MRNATSAYGKVATQIASPRKLEADLLLQAASQLQAVHDGWESKGSDLQAALLYNRKLWSIFLSSATDKESELPQTVRQNVANLGIFVLKQTMSLMTNPKPEQLGALININRELAAGLRAGS